MAIVWTVSARRDGNGTWDFIEARNPDAAELVSSEILRSVEGLLQSPKRGSLVGLRRRENWWFLGCLMWWFISWQKEMW
jgi:plasmid stabilization system protein ParE